MNNAFKLLILVVGISVIGVPTCIITGFSNGASRKFPTGEYVNLGTTDSSTASKVATFQKDYSPVSPPRTYEYIQDGWYGYFGEDTKDLRRQSHIKHDSWSFYERAEASTGSARQLNFINAAVEAKKENSVFVEAMALAQLA